MYSTLGQGGHRVADAPVGLSQGGPLYGPLGPQDFRPYLIPWDWDNLQMVLMQAAGQVPSGIGSTTPTLGGREIIPGGDSGTVGGFGYDSRSYSEWVAEAWGLPAPDSLETYAQIGASLRERYGGTLRWVGMTEWSYAVRQGLIGRGHYVSIQTIHGIPIEGWAHQAYCGDVVSADSAGVAPGPFVPANPQCQTLITVEQAASGDAGGYHAGQDGPPIVYGDPDLPPEMSLPDPGYIANGNGSRVAPMDVVAPDLVTPGGGPPPPIGPEGAGPGGGPGGPDVTIAGSGSNIGFLAVVGLIVLTTLGSRRR